MGIRYSKFLHAAIYICDWVILNIVLAFTDHFLLKHSLSDRHFGSFTFLANAFWIIISLFLKSHLTARPFHLKTHMRRLLATYLYFFTATILAVVILKPHSDYSRGLSFFYGVFFVVLIVFRTSVFIFLSQIRKRGFNLRHILIIGDFNMYKRVERSLNAHPEYGYHMLGFIPENEINNVAEDRFFSELESKRPDEIFICYKKFNGKLVQMLLKFGKLHSIKVLLLTDSLLKDQNVKLVNYEKIPVLHLMAQPHINARDKTLKRSFDVLFSLVVMTLGLPVFILLYIITKWTSAGPAFYQQERLGKNGRPFKIYKFRSMYINSEKDGPQLSRENDPRITSWGRLIRKTRLDELPQFWNVLIGDMSVVGPRPERQHFVEKIVERTPEYRALQYLKPGITSIGQIRYGYAENIDQMCDRLNYDFLYLNNINLNNDWDIILKTIKVVFKAKGK
ncbi:MAG: sugar transferase [Mucilaginibacter sp.]